MKAGLAALALAIPLMLLAPAAQAEDALTNHSIESVMARPENQSQLEGVRFYFGHTAPGAVSRRIERDATTSVRTRKFGRTNEAACQWVMLSALINLRNHAIDVGGNAVINVRSNWQNVEFSSGTEYQCSAGFLMAGVALKGDVVHLR